MATWLTARKIGLALADAVESTSYGTPALKRKKKLFARLLPADKQMIVASAFEDRDAMLTARPDVFSVTDHYRNHEWVIITLSKIDRADLHDLLVEAHRRAGPRT